ncbi:MAG: diaminopimelate epimerase [Rickettsiales bacterium]
MSVDFLKMHGLGNDFVIFDGRTTPVSLSEEQIRMISDRHIGVGCDQLIIMEPSEKADVFMRIYNADGGQVASCGNATRCVAWVLMEESGKDNVTLETQAGLLSCKRIEGNRICADMGEPKFDWQDIPLSEPRDTLNLGISLGELFDPVAVSMGNPHAIFIVSDVEKIRVPKMGPVLEKFPVFPERANISFAQPINEHYVKLKVWERGVGVTLACGTAACATLVGLHRRGLVGRKATIELPGGELEVQWDEATNHVLMTGAVTVAFKGSIDV